MGWGMLHLGLAGGKLNFFSLFTLLLSHLVLTIFSSHLSFLECCGIQRLMMALHNSCRVELCQPSLVHPDCDDAALKFEPPINAQAKEPKVFDQNSLRI